MPPGKAGYTDNSDPSVISDKDPRWNTNDGVFAPFYLELIDWLHEQPVKFKTYVETMTDDRMYTVGTIPCVVAMGVGTIRHACGGSYGRAYALASRSALGKGFGHAAGEKKGGRTSRLMEPRLSPISLGVPHAILGRKTQQKVEIQKLIFLRYGKDRKILTRTEPRRPKVGCGWVWTGAWATHGLL